MIATSYMTVEECAAYTGRTPEAVRQLAQELRIPHIRIDGRIQFVRERIDRWMERERASG